MEKKKEHSRKVSENHIDYVAVNDGDAVLEVRSYIVGNDWLSSQPFLLCLISSHTFSDSRNTQFFLLSNVERGRDKDIVRSFILPLCQ